MTLPPTRLAIPPMHDPTQRVLAQEVGEWQVRTFAWNDPKHRTFSARGMLHLQLYCPTSDVSVLTPSALTAKRYEVWMGRELRRVCCIGHLARLLVDERDLYLPSPCLIRRLESALVWAPMLGVAQPRISAIESPSERLV